MTEHMLTTTDNPWNPFLNFDEWYAWDQQAGYNTTGYLARIIKTSDELSEADQSLAYEQAIDEILLEDPLGLYMKVAEPKTSTTDEDELTPT